MKQFDDLLALHESVDFEIKKAQGRDGSGEMPHSFWETYSAMANTDGGVVVLGASEESDGGIVPIGIKAIAKVRKALWDNLNNKVQISANLLQDSDIQVIEHNGKQMLWVNIPRAARTQRPIYVGANPFTGTFRRSYEGDYRCDELTVRRMIAEATEESRDSRLLDGFGMEDLDPDSLAAYRNEFKSTKPGHPWLSLDDRELLRNLGGWTRDRPSGREGLTLAGLLMFGRLRSILDAVPNYIVDYQERLDESSEMRWVDRVTTDGTWSGNLFDFYRRVYPKLAAGLRVPFRLEQGFKRIDESHIHEALREALVNTLIHADYSGNIGIIIIKQQHRFVFRNPGGLRIPLNIVLAGGLSDCRNRNLQKMFQLVGAAEQAGSGFPKILRAWYEQHWRMPMLKEDHKTERTILQLPMTSLLPQEAIDELDDLFGADFRALSDIQRLALATALLDGRVTNERLRQLTNVHPSDITTLLRNLVDRGFLIQEGVGRGTHYHLRGRMPTSEVTLPLFEDVYDVTPHSALHVLGSEQIAPSSEQIAPDLPLVTVVHESRKMPREIVEAAILQSCSQRYVTLKELAELLNRSFETLRVHYLSQMIQAGRLELRYPGNPHHPEQAYRARSAG